MNTQKTNLWQVIKGAFAALLGVQSRTNATEDFQSGNLKTFIIVGIVMVVVIITVLAIVVNIVLAK